MGIKPTSEQWQALKPVERVNFRVTHSLNSSPKLRRILTRIGASYSKWWVECGTSKTVLEHGFENFAKIEPDKAVLLVANHRSFYDLFVIAARLFRLYGPHHNIYFPVRANFFYDNPLGLLINLKVAIAGMYPPIVRDRKRRHWNVFATDLMAELLRDPSNMVGFHPEGTRNRGPDPYAMLPAKPGCGELIHRSQPNVVPVFLQGFPKNPWEMLRENLRRSDSVQPMVHMVMGAPLDFAEELALPPRQKTYLLISRKVMASIESLSRQERMIRDRFERRSDPSQETVEPERSEG